MDLAHWSFCVRRQWASKVLLALLQLTDTRTVHTSRALCSFACVCSTSLILPLLWNHTQAQTNMRVCVRTQPRTHTCTPDPLWLCVCQVRRQTASKKGACDGVRAHLPGLASYSPIHKHTHTHLSSGHFDELGLISTTWRSTFPLRREDELRPGLRYRTSRPVSSRAYKLVAMYYAMCSWQT